MSHRPLAWVDDKLIIKPALLEPVSTQIRGDRLLRCLLLLLLDRHLLLRLRHNALLHRNLLLGLLNDSLLSRNLLLGLLKNIPLLSRILLLNLGQLLVLVVGDCHCRQKAIRQNNEHGDYSSTISFHVSPLHLMAPADTRPGPVRNPSQYD